MGNYRHGGRKFRSISEAKRRSTSRGMLNARRESEADIRFAKTVGPDGRGYETIEDVQTGQRYTVRDLSGGDTVRPGSIVPIGSGSGSFQQFKLGSPPGGGSKFGSPPRGRRPMGSIPPVVEADQYAFAGGSAIAFLYSGGTFVSHRATNEGIDGSVIRQCIFTDPNDVVGDGSAVGDSYVWDVEANVVHEVPGTPYYHNGRIYWIEGVQTLDGGDIIAIAFTLKSGLCDASDEQTISTFNIDLDTVSGEFPGAEFFEVGSNLGRLMVDDDGAVAYLVLIPQDGNGEISGEYIRQLRFALAGGAPAQREVEVGEPYGEEFATAGGSSFRILASDLSVYAKADNATTAPTTQIAAPVGPTAARSFGSNRVSGVQLYAQDGSGETFTLWRATDAATAWTQAAEQVEAYDEGENRPAAMFYFGEE